MKLSASTKISLAAMAAAISVVMLYAAGMIPYIRLVLLLVSSVTIYALLCEGEFLFAFWRISPQGLFRF